MALSFPLSLGQFQETFKIEELTFDTPGQQEISQTGAGEVLTRELGPRLWRGSLTLSNYRFDCGGGIRARIDLPRRPGASFLFYDTRHPYPSYDPRGRILADMNMNPKLRSVAANRRDITLYDLPARYELSSGDYLSSLYGSNPTRYALHQVVTGVTAPSTAGANTAAFEVTPPIRDGWVSGVDVRLIKPVCKAVMIPNTFTGGTLTNMARTNMSFEFIQTLR